jgi:hypothetical protein
MHNFSSYVRQPIPATEVFENQLLVIKPQLMEDSGLKIVYVHWIAGNVIPHLICFAVDYTGLDATSPPSRW